MRLRRMHLVARIRRTAVVAVVLPVAVAVAGCTGSASEAARAGGPAAPADRADPGAADQDGQPVAARLVMPHTGEEAARSLATLRRLDDHPLYEMTYYGAAPRLPDGATPPEPQASGTPQRWACTVFAADGDPQRPLLGRNFDWDDHPALVLHTDPPDGYASMSLVDISYLGYDAAHLGDLDRAEGRRRLLNAPRLPFDGMNERGLAIGMAQESEERPGYRPDRPTVGSLAVMRLALDHAATVAEAVKVLGSYNIDFSGGPLLHYLVADATGAAAVVEWVDGQIRVQPRTDQPWHLMVNFQLATSTPGTRAGDWRYRTASDRLARAGGKLDPSGAMDLLKAVAQAHTRWSVVYDLRAGRALIVTGKHYRTRRELVLAG